MVGIVTAVGADDTERLKPVLLAPDPRALLPSSLLSLANWVSRYYAAPPGLTLKAMLPGGMWGTSRVVAELRDPGRAPGGVGASVVE